jgi:hypothetical protein
MAAPGGGCSQASPAAQTAAAFEAYRSFVRCAIPAERLLVVDWTAERERPPPALWDSLARFVQVQQPEVSQPEVSGPARARPPPHAPRWPAGVVRCWRVLANLARHGRVDD